MVEIKTKSGFEIALDENITDDWGFLENVRKAADDAAYIIDVTKSILGDDGLEKLKAHVEDEDGRVKATLMVEEITEIMNMLASEKNS